MNFPLFILYNRKHHASAKIPEESTEQNSNRKIAQTTNQASSRMFKKDFIISEGSKSSTHYLGDKNRFKQIDVDIRYLHWPRIEFYYIAYFLFEN